MSYAEARNFANTINAIFELTSARTNDAGIEELFRAIGCKFLDNYYKKLPFKNKLNKFYSF